MKKQRNSAGRVGGGGGKKKGHTGLLRFQKVNHMDGPNLFVTRSEGRVREDIVDRKGHAGIQSEKDTLHAKGTLYEPHGKAESWR